MGYLAVFVLAGQQESFLVLSGHLHLIDYNFKLEAGSLFLIIRRLMKGLDITDMVCDKMA